MQLCHNSDYLSIGGVEYAFTVHTHCFPVFSSKTSWTNAMESPHNVGSEQVRESAHWPCPVCVCVCRATMSAAASSSFPAGGFVNPLPRDASEKAKRERAKAHRDRWWTPGTPIEQPVAHRTRGAIKRRAQQWQQEQQAINRPFPYPYPIH
jgi:hypothetical protein